MSVSLRRWLDASCFPDVLSYLSSNPPVTAYSHSDPTPGRFVAALRGLLPLSWLHRRQLHSVPAAPLGHNSSRRCHQMATTTAATPGGAPPTRTSTSHCSRLRYPQTYTGLSPTNQYAHLPGWQTDETANTSTPDRSASLPPEAADQPSLHGHMRRETRALSY